MSYWKLRDFLNKLQQLGELIRIQEPLSPHLEIPAVARYSTEACREAVVFDSTQGYPGFRMVSGFEAYSVDPRVRMKRVALALGLPGDIHPLELIRLLALARNRPPVAPVEIAWGPVQDHVLLHQDASLDRLPVPYIHVGDGGPYVNALGFIVTQTPDHRWTNWSIARVMKHDAHTMTGIVCDDQPIGTVADEWKQLGSAMPFALVLGASSALTFATGQALLRYGHDESSFLGAWFDKPVELVRCQTVDLLVPADAEIVIEGNLLADHLLPEGPTGDYHGYISRGISFRPTYRISAITHRENPLFPFTSAGKPVDEDHTITGTGIAANALEHFTSHDYSVVDAWIAPQTATHLLAVTLSDEFAK
jgi:UbiD family decarboxylase